MSYAVHLRFIMVVGKNCGEWPHSVLLFSPLLCTTWCGESWRIPEWRVRKKEVRFLLIENGIAAGLNHSHRIFRSVFAVMCTLILGWLLTMTIIVIDRFVLDLEGIEFESSPKIINAQADRCTSEKKLLESPLIQLSLSIASSSTIRVSNIEMHFVVNFEPFHTSNDYFQTTKFWVWVLRPPL